jgi:hypothetical protein
VKRGPSRGKAVRGVRLAARPYIDPRRIGVSPGAAAGAKGPTIPRPRKRLWLSLSLPAAAASATRADGA